MTMFEAVSAGAMGLLAVVLTVLLMQYLKLLDLWLMAVACRRDARWVRIWEAENRELRSALRAERAHIEQLQSKLKILQNLVMPR